MTGANYFLSVITLNVNGLKSSIKNTETGRGVSTVAQQKLI